MLRRDVLTGLAAIGPALLIGTSLARAADSLRIGLITTLSGPAGYIGEDIRDAFQLAVAQGGGKLGEVAVQLDVQDDGLKPALARQQADRMMQSGIQLFTGINFSNVIEAVLPSILSNGAVYVSCNPGPSTFAGARCNQNYFVISFQNDAYHEAAGLAANELGYKRIVLVAANYQAGRDALAGFKRSYQGEVLAELYTNMGQADFSIELARIRSLAPDAIYEFLPGGAGIDFAKQFENSGLNRSIPLLVPSFSMDARMVTAIGDAAIGVYASALWTPETNNAASHAFVEAFEKAYSRTPTMYAQQAYDTARIIGSALQAVSGDFSKREQFRAAMRAAKFESLRGNFRFGPNQHPIQDYYLTRFEKGSDGVIRQVILRRIASDFGDTYAAQCKIN